MALSSSHRRCPPPTSDLELTCASTIQKLRPHRRAVFGDAAVPNDIAHICRVLLRLRTRKKRPEYDGKPLRHWVAQAASEDAAKRRAAAEALGKIGPEGVPALLKLLEDKDHRVRSVATLAVTGMGPAAVPKLKDLIHDPDKPTRMAAIKALIQALVDMRARGPRQLIQLLRDPEPDVRFYAARSFTRVDRKAAEKAIPALKELVARHEPVRPTCRRLDPVDPRAASPEI